jgi:hypothetical protein
VAAAQAYESRSEAMRDLIRSVVETHRLSAEATGDCVANLSYVYNHHTRDLAQRTVKLTESVNYYLMRRVPTATLAADFTAFSRIGRAGTVKLTGSVTHYLLRRLRALTQAAGSTAFFGIGTA